MTRSVEGDTDKQECDDDQQHRDYGFHGYSSFNDWIWRLMSRCSRKIPTLKPATATTAAHSTPRPVRRSLWQDSRSGHRGPHNENGTQRRRNEKAQVLPHAKQKRGLRADKAPQNWNHKSAARVRWNQEREQAHGKQRGWTWQAECGHGRVAMTGANGPDGVDEQRKHYQRDANRDTSTANELEVQFAPDHALPDEHQRTSGWHSRENIGKWVDRSEESKVVGQGQPRPKESKNRRDSPARPRAGKCDKSQR